MPVSLLLAVSRCVLCFRTTQHSLPACKPQIFRGCRAESEHRCPGNDAVWSDCLWLVQYDNVHVRSITGFVVTAAPSALLSVAAWFLKRKFLTDISESQTDNQKNPVLALKSFLLKMLRIWKGWSLKVSKTLHCLAWSLHNFLCVY